MSESELDRLTAALTDRYRLERELGQGGMATVYLAEDVRHQRRVAVKVLRADLSAVVGLDRFLNEIRLTANLQHPHILPLYDSGSADGLLFYVMPYVQGESLRERLRREKQLPIDEAVRIAREVASALEYAHRKGVIHRDIKPENILLQDGTALVADFGIALAVSQAGGARLTQTGLSLGTPYYMSPEQATGDRQIDARSDIYALGAVLYEMLSGDPPHTGSTAQAVIAAVVTEEPRDIATRRPRLAPHIVEAVHRALEKLPADRYASAAEFAKALEGPTQATGRFAAAPTRRGARRGWRPVALLVAGGLLGLGAGRLLFQRPPAMQTRTRLTFSGDASSPAATRDGHWLAYVRGSCHSGGSDCDGDVVVQELPRGAPSALLSNASDLSIGGWSPDGTNLLVKMRSAGGDVGLYVIPRQGGVARRVGGDAEVYGFLDDRTIASAPRGARAITFTDLASGNVRDSVVIGNGDLLYQGIDCNPVNGLILFTAIRGSDFLQGVATPTGKILDSLKVPGGGGWDVDGHHAILFEVNAQSVGRVVRVAVSAQGHFGPPVEIMSGIRQDGFTGWAMTPTGMVYGDAGRTADVWFFDLHGTARRLTHGSTWYNGPVISPDGRTVAYVKQDAWGANVYSVPSLGGRETALTGDSGIRQVVRWLPDQRRLSDVVLAGASGQISQEIVDPAIGRVHTLGVAPGLVITNWFSDTAALALQIGTPNTAAIVDSAGHDLHRFQIPDSLGTGLSYVASPDGKKVAMVLKHARQSTLYARDVTDGTIHLLGPVSQSDSVTVRLARWAPDGFIYYTRTSGMAPTEVWRISDRGGVPTRYGAPPAGCDAGSVSLSQDGESGACIVYDNRPDLWLIQPR
ncbi:MAG TPA: protein kinase [Gemmatimonadales bacterium]|nr:protein kinase [Gemmatimonadales bacterium]